MGWKKLVVLGLCAWGGWHLYQTHGPVKVAPGVAVKEAPYQIEMAGAPFSYGEYQIRPLAKFRIRARVLASKTYSSDREAELSPIDLALGWGRMSDSAVYSQLSFSQNSRFAFWRYENQPPIPVKEIETSASNMHMIPADADIEAVLRKVRPGQIVYIEGHLIEAVHPQGWLWRSSLSRQDTGKGACEVIWVQRVEIEEAVTSDSI